MIFSEYIPKFGHAYTILHCSGHLWLTISIKWEHVANGPVKCYALGLITGTDETLLCVYIDH